MRGRMPIKAYWTRDPTLFDFYNVTLPKKRRETAAKGSLVSHMRHLDAR